MIIISILFFSMFSALTIPNSHATDWPYWDATPVMLWLNDAHTIGMEFAYKQRSHNQNSILFCLDGGTCWMNDTVTLNSNFYKIPSLLEPFTTHFPIMMATHNMTYYLQFNVTTGDYDGIYGDNVTTMNGFGLIARALKRDWGFDYVHILGFSAGSTALAYALENDPNINSWSSATMIDGIIHFNWYPYDPILYLTADNAHEISTPTYCNVGQSDMMDGEPPEQHQSNRTWQMLQFWNDLSLSSTTKKLSIYQDGHNVLDPSHHDVQTGWNFLDNEIVWIMGQQTVLGVECVNDGGIIHTDAWENFTTGLDPDSLALVNNGSDSCFTAYCKRVGADEWGDCIARQGYYPHLNSYCLDWNNKLIKPMVHYPYIPANVGDNQIILQATAKHSAPIWYGNWPPGYRSPWPTIGATIMLYFNVYVHDNIHNVDKWLFNFHEPNPFAGPNLFILEIFLTRWIVADEIQFTSCAPGFPAFEQFFTSTSHDNDLHLITCPFAMPTNDQWYYMIYDVGNKLYDATMKIEAWGWITEPPPSYGYPCYDVLGFQLMTIAMGVETIGGSWTFKFDDISLTDMRWGTGSAYTNSAKYQLKTRADGIQSVPSLNGSIGLPNPLRPYMTYTNDTLDADINNDGHVNYWDLILLLIKYGSREMYPSLYPPWDYAMDIIPDRVIDYIDLLRLLILYGASPTTGTYQTGLRSIKVWMQEVNNYGGLYWPDPPPGYVGPPWKTPRTVPYTCHLYLETWDVMDWPDYVSRTISYNPCINYMGSVVFYNGITLNQTGTLMYAYDYPIHD